MVKKLAFAALLFGTCTVSNTAMAATQILSFGGTLSGGWNGVGGPFGPNGDLTGKTYSVVLSYDPGQFVSGDLSVNSCGFNASNSCTYTFSAARTLTHVITIDGITQTTVATSGSLTLNSGGNDTFSFTFSKPGSSWNGSFVNGNSFFPDQANVNNPVFSNFTNLLLSPPASYNHAGSGFSLNANPRALTASLAAPSGVPEPSAWAMMLLGFGAVGFMMRFRTRGTTRQCV